MPAKVKYNNRTGCVQIYNTEPKKTKDDDNTLTYSGTLLGASSPCKCVTQTTPVDYTGYEAFCTNCSSSTACLAGAGATFCEWSDTPPPTPPVPDGTESCVAIGGVTTNAWCNSNCTAAGGGTCVKTSCPVAGYCEWSGSDPHTNEVDITDFKSKLQELIKELASCKSVNCASFLSYIQSIMNGIWGITTINKATDSEIESIKTLLNTKYSSQTSDNLSIWNNGTALPVISADTSDHTFIWNTANYTIYKNAVDFITKIPIPDPPSVDHYHVDILKNQIVAIMHEVHECKGSNTNCGTFWDYMHALYLDVNKLIDPKSITGEQLNRLLGDIEFTTYNAHSQYAANWTTSGVKLPAIVHRMSNNTLIWDETNHKKYTDAVAFLLDKPAPPPTPATDTNKIIKCFYDSANNNTVKTKPTKVCISIGGSGTQFNWGDFNGEKNQVKAFNNLKQLLIQTGAHGLDFDIENRMPALNPDGTYAWSGLLFVCRNLKKIKYTAVDGKTIGPDEHETKLLLTISVLVGNAAGINDAYPSLLDADEDESKDLGLVNGTPLFDYVYLMSYNGGAWVDSEETGVGDHASGTCLQNNSVAVSGYWDIWVAWWLGLTNYTGLYGDTKTNTYSFDNKTTTLFKASKEQFNIAGHAYHKPERLFLGLIGPQAPLAKSNPYNKNLEKISKFITDHNMGGYFLWWYSSDYEEPYTRSLFDKLSNIKTTPPSPAPTCPSSGGNLCGGKVDDHQYFDIAGKSFSFIRKLGSLSKTIKIDGTSNSKLYFKDLSAQLELKVTGVYNTSSNPFSFIFDKKEDAEVLGLDVSSIPVITSGVSDPCYYDLSNSVDTNYLGDAISMGIVKNQGLYYKTTYWHSLNPFNQTEAGWKLYTDTQNISRCLANKVLFSSTDSSCHTINIVASKIKKDETTGGGGSSGGSTTDIYGFTPPTTQLTNVKTVLYANIYSNFSTTGIPNVDYLNMSSLAFSPVDDDYIEQAITAGFISVSPPS